MSKSDRGTMNNVGEVKFVQEETWKFKFCGAIMKTQKPNLLLNG
jgi:hypothetical protein